MSVQNLEIKMSRILFETQVHGKTFPIALGWDRRLSQCFVSVSDLHLDEEDYDDERFEAILEASSYGLCQNLGVGDCRAILEAASVVAPPGTFEVLAEHVRVDAGNLIVELDASGAVKVIYDEAASSTVS
jgi:hypothetical protein